MMAATSTNSEKLDKLFGELSQLKTNVALMNAEQQETNKILKGNGKKGLVERFDCQEHQVNQIENTLSMLLAAKAKEAEKKENIKDKWYWLLVEKFAVPIAMAAITAYILAPLLAK